MTASTPPNVRATDRMTDHFADRHLYIAWAAFQRRPASMASLVGLRCVFLPLRYKGPNHLFRAWHYLLLLVRTWRLLCRERPAVVWLQLPQLPLLWPALLYRALIAPSLRIAADCHNAVFVPPWSKLPLGVGLLRRCDVVLVHNEAVVAQALALGVPAPRLQVLEDVPPRREPAPRPPLPPLLLSQLRPWVLFPGSFGRDEPIAAVFETARLMTEATFIVTGRRGNAARNGHDLSAVPPNVVLTDYLALEDFEALLTHSDVVLALTEVDGIQLSVCNEALGWGKPMVMSGTPVLRRLFGTGARVLDSHAPAAIAAAVREVWNHRGHWTAASAMLAVRRRAEWLSGPWRECLRVLSLDRDDLGDRGDRQGRDGRDGRDGREGLDPRDDTDARDGRPGALADDLRGPA